MPSSPRTAGAPKPGPAPGAPARRSPDAATPPETDADIAAAWDAYRRLHQFVDAAVARELEQQSGLSMPDYEVLAALAAMTGPDSCIRVRGLAAHLHWAHSRLSRQLGRMEARGLIAREPCERDGRGDDVVLTDQGREAYDQAAPGHLASVHRHFTGLLSPAQRAALVGIERTVRLAGTGQPTP
ncbi:MarR family winged helix-turn-helix transcriptional regulator [Streptodolium elevatio]|uniref:MarR family winged helix-turn-helix transcriptional regulator n=1 Tax=Streptodolium elevatio TaxID=3157996 RepID=A0ABV3DD94_9ACTN